MSAQNHRAFLTPADMAAMKRKHALEAVDARFWREAEGKTLNERLCLSIAMQAVKDGIEADYREEMGKSLHRAVCGTQL